LNGMTVILTNIVCPSVLLRDKPIYEGNVALPLGHRPPIKIITDFVYGIQRRRAKRVALS